MKRFLITAAVALGLNSCLNQSGAVSTDAVQEMLASPQMAVTPFQPFWLNETGKEEAWKLSPEARRQVCDILLQGEHRYVPELAYQIDDERNPMAENRFYIYASNGQCLAGTLLEQRVAMHDVVLSPEQEQQLFQVLKPYLKHVFPELK